MVVIFARHRNFTMKQSEAKLKFFFFETSQTEVCGKITQQQSRSHIEVSKTRCQQVEKLCTNALSGLNYNPAGEAVRVRFYLLLLMRKWRQLSSCRAMSLERILLSTPNKCALLSFRAFVRLTFYHSSVPAWRQGDLSDWTENGTTRKLARHRCLNSISTSTTLVTENRINRSNKKIPYIIFGAMIKLTHTQF